MSRARPICAASVPPATNPSAPRRFRKRNTSKPTIDTDQKTIKQPPQIAEAATLAHSRGILRGVKVNWVPMEPVLNSDPIITVIRTTTANRPA